MRASTAPKWRARAASDYYANEWHGRWRLRHKATAQAQRWWDETDRPMVWVESEDDQFQIIGEWPEDHALPDGVELPESMEVPRR